MQKEQEEKRVERKTYERPAINEIGNVRELTQGSTNAVTDLTAVGSL